MGKLKEVSHKAAFVGVAVAFIVYSILAIVAYVQPDLFAYSSFFSVYVTEVMLMVFGVFVMRLAHKRHIDPRSTKFAFGFFVFLFGLFPVLVDFNLLRFLPVRLEMEVNHFLLALVLLVAAAYFVVDRLHVPAHDERNEYS